MSNSLKCWYCGSDLVAPPVGGKRIPNMRTVDHVLPRFRGGTSELSNLVEACWSCIASKKSKTLEEYRLWLFEKTPHGRARKLLVEALGAWPEMPIHQQTGVLDAVNVIDENYPLPVFFGERE